MNIQPFGNSGVRLIEPSVFGDDRGFFLETWSESEFRASGIEARFVQDNWSRSARGVLRGLHFQAEHTQGKLVRCVSGAVFDVAVDIRKSSPSFGEWVGLELNQTNKRALWIPPGFAHGFLTLSETADFQYKCTDIYHPESECSIRWDDADLGIRWPIETDMDIQLSEKDSTRAQAFAKVNPLP